MYWKEEEKGPSDKIKLSEMRAGAVPGLLCWEALSYTCRYLLLTPALAVSLHALQVHHQCSVQATYAVTVLTPSVSMNGHALP